MKNKFQPIIRVAETAELRVYPIYEHQLELLAQGSPASLHLNFALFFIGVAITALGTLLTAPPDGIKTFVVFVCIFLVTFLFGIVLATIWWKNHKASTNLVAEIKAQTPKNPPAKQLPAVSIEYEEAEVSEEIVVQNLPGQSEANE
jgi:hypothetical protein